jgi:hypothetical protein
MKIITMSALILALSSGAAFADRHGGRGGGGGGGGRAVVHENHGGSWGGGVSVHSSPRVVVHNGGFRNEGFRHEGFRGETFRGGYRGGYVARNPIYVRRPIIRERYYDYRYRPRILVENYAAMDGYYWVSGQWTWDGGEWIWTPGHYEPNAYVDPGYDSYE